MACAFTEGYQTDRQTNTDCKEQAESVLDLFYDFVEILVDG